MNNRLLSVTISSSHLQQSHSFEWDDMEYSTDDTFPMILRDDNQHSYMLSDMKGDWEMVKGIYKDVAVDDVDDLAIMNCPIETVVLLKGDDTAPKEEVSITSSKDQTIEVGGQDMNEDELDLVSDKSTSNSCPESDKEEDSESANEMEIDNETSVEDDIVIHKEVLDETVSKVQNEVSSAVVIEDHKEELEVIPKECLGEVANESSYEDVIDVPSENINEVPTESSTGFSVEGSIDVPSESINEVPTESSRESSNEDTSEPPNETTNQVEMEIPTESDIPSENNDGLLNQLYERFDSNSDSHVELNYAVESSKTPSVNDNLSLIPQASLNSVGGESVITCETGYNDIDSIPAAVNDYSDISFDMTVSDIMDDEDLLTSEPNQVVESNSKPFRLISANALLESESDDDQLSPTTNSLSIEDSSDEELKQYLVKSSSSPKPKPYRCHRSRSPPRNNPPRINSPIKQPVKPERLIPHQLLNGHGKPKPIARPEVPTSFKGYHESDSKNTSVKYITPIPSQSFITPSEPKHSFQFAEDLYSRLNMKLSMIEKAKHNETVESSSLSSSPSDSLSDSATSLSSSSSSSVSDGNPKPVVGGVRRTTPNHYEPILENASLIHSLNLSDYIPAKKSVSSKTVTKEVIPETTPIIETSNEDDQNLILSEEEQLLLHNPEKKLELMVYLFISHDVGVD